MFFITIWGTHRQILFEDDFNLSDHYNLKFTIKEYYEFKTNKVLENHIHQQRNKTKKIKIKDEKWNIKYEKEKRKKKKEKRKKKKEKRKK